MQDCWLLLLTFKTRTWVSAKQTQTSWKIIPLVFWTLVFFPVASVILSEVVEHKSSKLNTTVSPESRWRNVSTVIYSCCFFCFLGGFRFWLLKSLSLPQLRDLRDLGLRAAVGCLVWFCFLFFFFCFVFLIPFVWWNLLTLPLMNNQKHAGKRWKEARSNQFFRFVI